MNDVKVMRLNQIKAILGWKKEKFQHHLLAAYQQKKLYIHFQKYYHSKKLHKEVSQIILDDAFLLAFFCNLAKNLGSMVLC